MKTEKYQMIYKQVRSLLDDESDLVANMAGSSPYWTSTVNTSAPLTPPTSFGLSRSYPSSNSTD